MLNKVLWSDVMEKVRGNILYVLGELTYLVPDLFLVLAVISVFIDFGQNGFLITLSLVVAYIGLAYGERYFHRTVIARQMVDDIVVSVDSLVSSLKEDRQHFVTIDGLINAIDMIEIEIDKKFADMKKEGDG
jgi:hypothetical protein